MLTEYFFTSLDLVYADTGDRVWWTWSVEDMPNTLIQIGEAEKCVSPIAGRPALEIQSTGKIPPRNMVF